MTERRCVIRADGTALAASVTPGAGPTVVFLPGYASDMTGSKALAIEAWAQSHGRAAVRFDYAGCGESAGIFADQTLTSWQSDAALIIDSLTTGPLILVGSSMGGWLMLLIAQSHAARVVGLIGIAAAPDFTDWGFSAADKAWLASEGRLIEPSAYDGSDRVTTLGFWRSGEANHVLDADIRLGCPVRLLHGQRDEVVPWSLALTLAERIGSADVQTVLIKDGDHRLSRPQDIALMIATLDQLIGSS